MEEIKVGDVVSLKSDDSAVFTVGYIISNDTIAGIYWYDHSEKTLKSKDVPVEILQK